MYAIQDVKFKQVIAPQLLNNATATQFGTYLDTFGFSSAFYSIAIGATDVALTALKLTECDTTGGSYTDVPLADFSVSPLTLPAATDDNTTWGIRCPVNGLRKRYQKLVVTAAGSTGTTGMYVGVNAILGNPLNAPYDATSQGLTELAIVAG